MRKRSQLNTQLVPIHFTALSDFDWFQIDLAANMEVMLVEFEGVHLGFLLENLTQFMFILIVKLRKEKILISKFGMEVIP